MAKKEYQTGGLDENNLPEGGSPSTSVLDYLDRESSSLPVLESIRNLRAARNPKLSNRGSIGQIAAESAEALKISQDPRIFEEAMQAEGYLTPGTNPELYKTVWQSDRKNVWNTLFNHMRPMAKSTVEHDLAKIRMQLAEYEEAKDRNDAFYAEGLLSKVDHSEILRQIEEGHLRGNKDQENLVDQLINTVMGGLSDALTEDDYLRAIERAEKSGLLNRDDLDKSIVSPQETYQSLLEKKEALHKDLAYREEEIKSGGFGSIGSGITSAIFGRGDKWYQQGIPLPVYGGGEVEKDYEIRAQIEKDKGATALSSIPIFSKMTGLSDNWTGDEYFQYKAAEDLAGSISTFEGQLGALIGPALVKRYENKIADKLVRGSKNPYLRTVSVLTQLGTIAAGNWWSRNLESKMEAGDAYWQKVDMLEQAWKEDLKKKGVDRELTKSEKNKLAIVAGEGLDALFQNNMMLGASDIMQFALTFMSIPGLSKSFTGNTFRNIAAKEITSRLVPRAMINAAKFSTAVGISRELEGMEEGLQFAWSQDYLGGEGQERSGSWLNNYWNAAKNTATDAVDYGMNMSGLRNSDPDMYNSVAFKQAVQSGRDMATMMTGGGRAVSNWGGLRSGVELRNAMSLLGEGGDQINRKRLFEEKKELLYKYFDSGRSSELYDAIYRMGRKLGTGQEALMSRQEAIDAIHEVQQAEKIYNDVFDKKSPLGISFFGIEYDLGRIGGRTPYSEQDKKKVFENALDVINNNKRTKELKELQESYREGKDESLDLFTTSLTPEEKAELENPNTTKKRVKELEDKMTSEGVSSEQKERIKAKMSVRGKDVTPYDLELLETSKDTERASKENEDIATEEKTWFQGAMWNISALKELGRIKIAQKEIMEKKDLTAADKITLADLIIEENKLIYEQGFEYNALKEGRLKKATKRAALMHGLGSVIQHIEKYGAEGLSKMLPTILDNNTKLDEHTLEEIGGLVRDVINKRGSTRSHIKKLKKTLNEYQESFDSETQTHLIHKPLTAEENETLIQLRKFEEDGTIDEEQEATLQNLVERAKVDKAINLLTEEIATAEAEEAALTEDANLAEKYIKRLEEDPDAFILKDSEFEEINDDAILKEAALDASQGLEYLEDQVKNVDNFADVENAERIYEQIRERVAIFKRRIVEASEERKDYFTDILDALTLSLGRAENVVKIVQANAADRTQEQYEVEQRMFEDTMTSLGLTLDFTLDEGGVFENIGKLVIEAVGQPALNILKNSLELNTDTVATTLVLQGLLKNALSEQSKVKTKLRKSLKKISEAQSKAVVDNINDNIGKDKVSTSYYTDNPKVGLKNILHQISTINNGLDFNNRDSALWKYVDHLSPHKVLEDILVEDRTKHEVSSQVLGEILEHHINHLRAEKQLNILDSDINVTDQLENERYIVKNNTAEFIPTKQQLQSIRELSVFLRSDINNKEDLTLGGSTAFLQGSAGTGKSKVVLPWAIQTSGIPNRNIFAFGHSITSSATINNALNLVKKDTAPNNLNDFIELDEAIAEELEVIIIDEAPALDDNQYTALEKKVRQINALKHQNKQPALKVLMLGDEAQLSKDDVLGSYGTFSEMHTLITPVTSIYRSDNPAIANFQDIFRRRKEDLSGTTLTVKLNKANPWMPNASGVYGVSGNFKDKILLKLQSPLPEEGRRVIITNPERKDEYKDFVKANKLQNVEVMSFIDAQGETIDEVYMDIAQQDMSPENFNIAIYAATSRAQSLIVAANLSLKNTIDPQLDAVQEGLSKEFAARRTEFTNEVEQNSKLLESFEELDERDAMHSSGKEEEVVEEEVGEDEFIEDVPTEEDAELQERTAEPEDKVYPEITEGEELNKDEISEEGYDSKEDKASYTENNTKSFYEDIDVSDKHVLYYPEYDALSGTTIKKQYVLPIQSNSPIVFVKGRAVARDGKIISGIVVLQEAREELREGTTNFEYNNKRVYRRIAVIGDHAEIDKMNFLKKKEKQSLKNALDKGVSIPLGELGIPGDKSLVSDTNNAVGRSNLLTGITIPTGGARRLSYIYGSREGAAFTANQPAASNFLRSNKKLINNILQMFIDQFYTESQPITEAQIKAIRNSRVKIFKKKDIADLNIPEGFTIRSGRPYLVIQGVANETKTQYIALTPRRLSRNIRDDVKNYFKPIDTFAKAAAKIESLSKTQLKLGTKGFVQFIKGADSLAKDIALNIGNIKIMDELIAQRDIIREQKWTEVSTNPDGSIDNDTQGAGPAQRAMNKLAQSNSLFRVEKRIKRNGKKIRIVSSKSLLSFPVKGQGKAPITTQLLETIFNTSDDKGYNHVLHLPLDIDMFNDLDTAGTSSVIRTAKDNHTAAAKVVTSQLKEIQGTKIILARDNKQNKEDKKRQAKRTKGVKPVRKKRLKGGRLGTKRLTGKDYAPEGDEKDLKGKLISKKDANKLLKKLLPDLFNKEGDLIPGNIVYLDALRMLELAEGKKVLGKFIDQRIFLLEQRDGIYDNVVRHEVFHKIMAYYLTDSERTLLLSTARAKYNLPKSMSNAQVEERLAREFMKFKVDETSVSGYIRKIFKKILKFLGFIDKNADNIEKLFTNIDSGYFAGSSMVGDPINTNMDYSSLIDEWGSVEIYREARSRFIQGMDSLLSEFDDGVQDIVSFIDYEHGEVIGAPMSRDESLNYLIENNFPIEIEELENTGLKNLDHDQTIVYKAYLALSDKRKAKSMFKDVYQRDKTDEGYELEESLHLDEVNLSDVINDANLKDHSKNLTQSVIEVLTSISYTAFNGKTRRLNIKHAYFKMLQLLTGTYDPSITKMRANIKVRSKNLGHRVGTAGKAVEDAIINLIDTSFNSLNEDNLQQIEVGKDRNKRASLYKQLKEISGRTKKATAKRDSIRKKLDSLDVYDFVIPPNLHFVNSNKFIFSLDPTVDASDLLHDLSGQEAINTVARKKNESSESFYYRIYTTLDENGLSIPTEALIALNRKNKTIRDFKNLVVNTASLRQENFMLGDFDYKWNDETKSSEKRIRFYKHKEFGTSAVIRSDIVALIPEHLSALRASSKSLLMSIKDASTNKEKVNILHKFMSLIGYPEHKVIIDEESMDQAIMRLEGFLKRLPDVGKMDKQAPKVESDKTGKMVYDVFTIQKLVDDEGSLIEALGNMLKLEHEATKAHSIKSVENKTIYAYHNSSFGVDVIYDFVKNRIPSYLKEGIYKHNIFSNGKSDIRDIHDWDGVIDRKRKWKPTTYSNEGEKQWLDRNFNYWFLHGLKESKGNLYYTQQLTTVSDKSSPKAAQVKLLNDQQIKESIRDLVDQYHGKTLKKSLIFSNILESTSLTKGQKVDRIMKVLNTRSKEFQKKLETEEVLKGIDTSKTLTQLKENKYIASKVDGDLSNLVDIFIKNYAINSFFLNQLVLGDTAHFKDSYDVVKRMSIAFAPGYKGFVNPLLGMKKTFRVAVMSDPQATAFDFLSARERRALVKDLKDLGLDSPIDLADGQGFVLPSRLKDLRRGFGGGFNPGTVMKPVYYGTDSNGKPTALKYSTTVLTDSLIGAHPGLAALRAQMELNEVDELIFKSGVKVGSPETLSDHGYPKIKPGVNFKTKPVIHPESILTLNNESLRLQLDPTADPNALVSNPTQLAYMINTNGLNAEAALEYYTSMAELINMGTKEFLYDLGLMNSTGAIKSFLNLNKSRRNAIEKKIRNKIIAAADITESAHKEAEVLSAKDDKGKPAVTINFPAIVNKIFQHLASSLTKATVKIKFPGSKLVLQSAYGATITDPVTGTQRPLKHVTADRPYAEVLMPRAHSEKFQIGDEIYDEYMMGFRIPSTELHSSVALKVVGFYDAHDSNIIIAPKELVSIHGSDFDVDSLFVIRKAHASDKSKSGKSLYTNQDVGLRSRKGTILLDTNETVPSTSNFIITVNDDINWFRKEIRNANQLIKLAADEKTKQSLVEQKKFNRETMEVLQRVKGAAIKNRMLDTYLKVIIHEKNRESILSPITMSNLKGRVKDGKDLDNSVFGQISQDLQLPLQDNHDQLYENRDLTDPLDELYMHQSNQSGSALTGAGANAMKALVYMMEGSGEGQPAVLVNKRTEDGDIVPFEFTIDGITYNSLSRHEKLRGDKKSKHTVWQTMDSIINAAIDNAKEQILNILNLNQSTASMFYVMVGTGVPLTTAVRILLQPAVKEAARRNPKDFAAGAESVRKDIAKFLGSKKSLTEEKLKKIVDATNITSNRLSDGVQRTSPKYKRSFEKQIGGIEDAVFQLQILDLLSPGGNRRGLNKFGNDLTKMASTLKVLQQLPSDHEAISELVENMNSIFEDVSSFGFEVSNMLQALPHLQQAKDTAEMLHTITSEILQVNNNVLKAFVDEVNKKLGKTSTSEDRLNTYKRNKILREQYVRFIAGMTTNTRDIKPIEITIGNMTTIVSGTQALSHQLTELMLNLTVGAKQSNAFLNRISPKRDKRGVRYIVSNAAGITQEELVEIYADFHRLDPELQEQFLQYSIAKEGMLFAASNITMLIDPKLFAGYDQKRADLLEKLLQDPNNLETTKSRFLLQYALGNPGLLASIGNKKINSALVKENDSVFGTRRTQLTTGEMVFYDLKIDNDLIGEAPLLMSNPNYNQVYIKVHEDVAGEEAKGYSYYQVIAKGSNSASFYTTSELDLVASYDIDKHFPKGSLVRKVEDVNVDTIELYKEVKGLEKGDKLILRTHDDVLREYAVETIVSSVKPVTVTDKVTGIKSTNYTVTLEKERTELYTAPVPEEPSEIAQDETKDKPAYQKISDAQTISEDAMQTIVAKLERRFGFSAKVVNKPETKWAGKFVADTPVINIANMRADTAFHEFAHPWVEAIFVKNKGLFESLKRELIRSPEGQAIIAKVQNRYPELKGDEFFKEAIVTAIGEYAAGMIDEKGKGLGELLFELIQRIGKLIQKLWDSKAIITPEELSGMNLRKLALLMAEGDARLETHIVEFQNLQQIVTKENFLNRLQGEGVVSPGQVNGYYAIMDIVPGTTEILPDLYAKNEAIVQQYEKDYPGLIRQVGRDVVFDFNAPIENFETNAKYQIVENEPTDEKGFEKIVEEDTIKGLETARDVEKIKLSSDESNYEGISGVYKRLTHFIKTGILGQTRDTVDSEYNAKRTFERNKRDIENDTVTIENKEYTYKELVDKNQKKSNNSTARGKAVHKLMEWLVTKDKRTLRDLREIQKEKPDQDEITDASLKWVEQVGEGVLRKIGFKDTDKMKAELMLHSPILGVATQIDGLIQHEDGTLTMVDWKSGGYFLNDRSTAQFMRYSTGTINDVGDSKLNKAMLELALRAIMVKEHQPNAIFRQILVHHLERNNPFKQPFQVHLRDYLLIISNYLQAEKPEVYKALKEKGLLESSNYTTSDVRNSAALDKYSHQPLKEQIKGLEQDIEILRTKIATPGLSKDLASDKALLEVLSNEYLKLTKTSKESLDSEGQLGDFKAWASSIYNINSPRIQAFNKIFRKASQKSQDRITDEQQVAEKLFSDVRKEYLAKNPDTQLVGMATLGVRSGFDYKGMYDFAFEYRLDSVQTPGMYMISLEDAKKKHEAGTLTDAQYNLLKHIKETWNTQWSELMDKKMESGNPYSKTLGMFNLDNAVVEGKLHENFMPRLPMENSEAYEKFKGEGLINRQVKGTGAVLRNFARKTFSMFIEENYYGQTETINAHIPVRFMGSASIIGDELHSFNLERMHYDFTSNLIRKQEMDFVVALGDGLKSFYNTMKNLKGADDKGWSNYEKFMENFVINSVMQEKAAGRGAHWSAKKYNIPNPFYNPNKPTTTVNKPSYQFSVFKLMMSLKHLTTGKALWFKVIGGTFNGAIILMYTVMKAIQGSTAKRLGYDPGVIDVTTSTLGWAAIEVAKYFGDQILRAVTNKPSDNKLHNLLKRFKYLPDNYDYAVDHSDMMNVKNPALSYNKLFFFHAIHEEWGHALLLAAQMKAIKMPDGSSIWDSYDNDGTFKKVKNGKRNIRGVITEPSGVKRVIDELTEDEINKMLKMSTDIHGAYRTHERTVLESTAVGVWALQFKKYLPALLIQEWESRKDDVYMGKYTAFTDEKGNKKIGTEEVEMEIDGKKQMVTMDTLDWITWQHEGRVKVLLKLASGTLFGGQYTNYKWSNLNERDKYDLYGILSKFMAYALMVLAVGGLRDDDELEEALLHRFDYLTMDALQALHGPELLRTLKNPFAVITHGNSIIEAGWSLEGQRRNIPFLSVGYEMERYGLTER